MIPYQKGRFTRQAHVEIPEGTVEEEFARNGFFGRYAHFYRTEPPVAWSEIDGPLKPRAYKLSSNKVEKQDDFFSVRQSILKNDDVHISFVSLSKPMTILFRNADADELYFVHNGAGTLECDFGSLGYEKGDYLLIPRGTMFAFFPSQPSQFLLVESASEFEFPEKGMLGQHALFDPSMIETPDPCIVHKTFPTELHILREGKITKVHYPKTPLNVVGWKGTLSVLKINVRDIRPISSDRYHLPPSAHTTFVAHNFVVCTFLPRPLENGDPEALKVPFYHSNIDFDEVLFYHEGEFFSRDGISPGMLTFHPQGIAHGPQSKAISASKQKTHTNEIAVMIDTKRPLHPSVECNQFEVSHYYKSWQE